MSVLMQMHPSSVVTLSNYCNNPVFCVVFAASTIPIRLDQTIDRMEKNAYIQTETQEFDFDCIIHIRNKIKKSRRNLFFFSLVQSRIFIRRIQYNWKLTKAFDGVFFFWVIFRGCHIVAFDVTTSKTAIENWINVSKDEKWASNPFAYVSAQNTVLFCAQENSTNENDYQLKFVETFKM